MKKTAKLALLFFSVCFLLVFFCSSFFLNIEAQALELDYPEIGGITPVPDDAPLYAKYIFNLGVLLTGLILFGSLVWGGVLYLISFGRVELQKTARERITGAVTGLLILVSAYVIFAAINPQLTIWDFRITPLTPVEPPDTIDFEALDMSVIAYEIPLNEIIKGEGGIWEKTTINSAANVIKEFENFLKRESGFEKFKINSRDFERISDLNKYLEGLADKCDCSQLIATCSENSCIPSKDKPCSGDPCNKQRKEINQILNTNKEITEKLKEFRAKISRQLGIFTENIDKFYTGMEELEECLNQGKVFAFNEFLVLTQQYEEMGWNVEIIESKDYLGIEGYADPLTFYCVAGGTTLDAFKLPDHFQDIDMETPLDLPQETTDDPPLYCPIMLPIAEMLGIVGETAEEAASEMKLLVAFIDELTKEIGKVTENISLCNKDNCETECSCLKNWCYEKCAPSIGPFPNPCFPYCLNPCIGDICFASCVIKPGKKEPPYNGKPCPIDDIRKNVEEIKDIEDHIFKYLKELKTNLSREPYIIDTPAAVSDGSYRYTTKLDLNNAAKTAVDIKVTAYYSPVPGQTKYVTGSYESEIKLEGTHNTAIGLEPMLGTIAADVAYYPYGTYMEVPGYGFGVVMDIGGAIKGANHIDVWVGIGDEGREAMQKWTNPTVKVNVYTWPELKKGNTGEAKRIGRTAITQQLIAGGALTNPLPVDLLDFVRTGAQMCYNKDPNEPLWFIMDCLTSIGNIGPGDDIILGCHPSTYFCCTADRTTAQAVERQIQRDTQRRMAYYSLYSQDFQIPNINVDAGQIPVPLFRQGKSGWCGRTSVQMIVGYYYEGFSRSGRNQFQGQTPSQRNTGGHLQTRLKQYLNKPPFNLNWCRHSGPAWSESGLNLIIRSLSQGHPVLFYSGLWRSSTNRWGHIMVFTGYKDGVFYINNPRVRGSASEQHSLRAVRNWGAHSTGANQLLYVCGI